MHFTHSASANNSKTTKIATVIAIHAVLGYGLIQSMSTVRVGVKPPEEPFILIDVPKKVEPPKPIEPPPKAVEKPVTKPELPVVPTPEVKVETPVESPIAVNEVADPEPVAPGPVVSEPAKDTGAAAGNGIRTAVFAEGCAVPEYPTSSLRNGEEGTVVLALMVSASGKVDSAKVTKSSGHRNLDRAAQNALSLCKFQPAMDNGQPQAGWAQISYNWKLDS